MALDLLGVLMALGAFVFLIGIALYVFGALVLMTIAKKTNTPNGWLAWIPVGNIYLMTQIAGLSGWWTLIIFAAIIPFVGVLAMCGVMIWLWWLIAEKRGRPGWWSILLLIPIVNFVIMGMLAWSEA
jgi:hypothetical protein